MALSLGKDPKGSDVLAAFHAEQLSYLEKKKREQKRKGEGRDTQVMLTTRNSLANQELHLLRYNRSIFVLTRLILLVTFVTLLSFVFPLQLLRP